MAVMGYSFWIIYKKPDNIYLKNLFKPRFCIRHRSEAYKTLAKREVGAILNRRHIHKYVEDQNRETRVAARLLKPQ
jgi:hypothetical protein